MTRVHYQDEWCFQHVMHKRDFHAATATTRECQPTKNHEIALVHVPQTWTNLVPQVPKEAGISLLKKFEVYGTKLWEFVNQVHLFLSSTPQMRNNSNIDWIHWIIAHQIQVFVNIRRWFSAYRRPWSIFGKIQQKVLRKRSYPYNNTNSNTKTTIIDKLNINCKVLITCTWSRLEQYAFHHHVLMQILWRYQYLVDRFSISITLRDIITQAIKYNKATVQNSNRRDNCSLGHVERIT